MPKLFTIGHSNRTLEEFIALLHEYGITHVVDVRTLPKSRHVPWFNKDEFKKALRKAKIAYTHMPSLGGMRKPLKDSINTEWRRSGFRGYADYMQTPKFFESLKALNELVKKNKHVAIMCAEAVPWRCHRSLIADAEVVRGVKVMEIISKTSVREHKLTEFAVVDRDRRPIRVFYPGRNGSLLE